MPARKASLTTASPAVTATPTAGTAKLTVFNITCSLEPNNDSAHFSASAYPTEPEIKYYFALTASGQPTLKSNPFSTNNLGKAEWNGVLIPAAGSWTATLRKAADDSSVDTVAITVS